MYIPRHTAEIVPDQIDDHEVFGLLFRRVELRFGHSARGLGSFLDGPFDRSELASAFSGPGEKPFGTTADDFCVHRGVRAGSQVEVGAEGCWVGGAEAQVYGPGVFCAADVGAVCEAELVR